MCYALQKLGYSTTFVIPNRLTDGYGNQENLVVENINQYNTKLVITVDNGITSKNLVQTVKSMGVDIIITDHHLPDNSKIPETLIVDPKYGNDIFSDICGAFVALKLIYSLYKEVAPNQLSVLQQILPLAGIATVADMMPMLNENRNLVKLTLAYINNIKYQQSNPLYKILYALGGENFLKSQEEIATEELISFNIAPSINAVSRVDGSVIEITQKILNVLNQPLTYFPSYKKVNIKRQQLTIDLLNNFSLDAIKENSIVYIYENNFGSNIKGILGLLANKLAVKYNKITLIGTKRDEETIEFSGRSLPTYNLHEGIERIKNQHPEFQLEGGGHSQAMGIRLLKNKIDDFRDAFENDIKENSKPFESTIFKYEPEMENEIISTMEDLQPFGAGFKKLVFQFTGIFQSYDKFTKMATINGKEFRAFLSEADAKSKLNTEITFNFTVSFSSIYGPFYTIVKE